MAWWMVACMVAGALCAPVVPAIALAGAVRRAPAAARVATVALGVALAAHAALERAVRLDATRRACLRRASGEWLEAVVVGRVDRGRYGTAVVLRELGSGAVARARLRRFDVAPGDTVIGRIARGRRRARGGSHTVRAYADARIPRVRLREVRLKRRRRTWAWRAHEAARRRLVCALAPHAGLAVALAVGERGGIDARTRRAIDRLGVAHVFALSGMHLAVVAWLVGWLSRRRHAGASLAGVALLATYATVAGAIASLWRAWWMAAAAAAAHGLGRPVRARDALGAACALLLVDDPSRIDDLGFRLSVLATAVLVAVGPVVARAVRRAPRRARIPAALAGSLVTSAMVAWALAPIETAAFGGVAPAAAPATVLLGLVVPLALGASLALAAVPTGRVPPPVLQAAAAAFGALEHVIVAMARLAPARVPVPGWLWASATGLAWIALRRFARARRARASGHGRS